MARPVKLHEFSEWLSRNRHRTWTRVEPRPDNQTWEIKYFYPSFDTRAEAIFYIGTNHNNVFGSHNDEHETVLTALEARLDGVDVKPLDLLSDLFPRDSDPSKKGAV